MWYLAYVDINGGWLDSINLISSDQIDLRADSDIILEILVVSYTTIQN